LFFEAKFFIIICKKNRELRDFSYLKVRSNFDGISWTPGEV